jgi:hypothetical protein
MGDSMAELILTMYYPKSGITQAQEYLSLNEAILTAHTHLHAFPAGYAQITDKASGEVVMANEDLLAGLANSRRSASHDEDLTTGSGFLARWFSPRNDGQAA